MSRKLWIFDGLVVAASMAVILAAAPASAKDHCTNAPTSQWKPVHEISTHATQLGYSVVEIERDGTCYEVKGYDKNGAKIEIKYDPQSGMPVKAR